MKRHFCDKCGEEIFLNGSKWGKTVGNQHRIGYHELCDNCYEKWTAIRAEYEKATEIYHDRRAAFWNEKAKEVYQ